jgi:hypothetical protein
MNSVRKVFRVFSILVAAVALAAFALPAAADKIFTLNMSPPSLTAGSTNQSLTATFANVSDSAGNSTAKSLKLYAPNGITIVSPANGATVNLGGGFTGTVQNNGTSLFISNIQLPLKPFGPALPLAMTVNVACTATGGAWAGSSPATMLWNGSAWTGQTFAYTLHPPAGNPDSQPNTSIDPGCVNFTFTTTPNPSSVGPSSGAVTAKFTNTSAAANLGSAQVTAPVGLTVNPSPASTSSNGGTVSVSGQVVTVQGGSPVAPNGAIVLTLSVTTTPSCTGAAAAAWSSAQAYTGGSLNGAALVFQGSYPSTSVIADSCSLSFVSPPAGAAQNTPFSLKVHVTGGSGSPSVTIAATGTGCPALSGTLTQSAPVGSDTTFSGLSFSGTGTCTVTASASNYNNTNATLTSFRVLDGTLACAPPGDTASSAPTSPPLDPTSSAIPPTDGQTGWALVRGLNTDGGCGERIPFSANVDNATRTVIFTEISNGQHPSIEYIILWPPVAIGSPDFDFWADKKPCVAWGMDNPQFVGPDAFGCGGDYIPGLACLTDDVDGGSAVMPDIPAVAPYSNFTSTDHPQYQPTSVTGNKAKACIAQHGFSSGTGPAFGSVIYWTKIIDQSDIGVRLP